MEAQDEWDNGETVMENLIKYFVWNPEGYTPRQPHSSYDDAKREADRLARTYPGQSFVVLKPAGVAIVHTPPTYREFTDDDFIPF